MFFTILLMTTLASCFAIFFVCRYAAKHDGAIVLLVITSILLSMFSLGTCINVIEDVTTYNETFTKTKIMQPVTIDIVKYNNATRQLATTQNMIKEIMAKYQIQAQVQNLNGVKIYTMPMSASGVSFQGLGDIERGAGEKLKNLEVLLTKQEQIANTLVQMQNAQYKEEFYTLNQQLNAMRYSLFDGWIVRAFGIKESDIAIVSNDVYYATGVNVNNN